MNLRNWHVLIGSLFIIASFVAIPSAEPVVWIWTLSLGIWFLLDLVNAGQQETRAFKIVRGIMSAIVFGLGAFVLFG